MTALKIISSGPQSYTTISNTFFDTYMAQANGEFVKVYLYLCRWNTQAGADFSLAHIADSLSMTEGDIIRALKYWETQGLMTLSLDHNNQLSSITLLSLDNAQPKESLDKPVVTHPSDVSEKAKDTYTKPNYSMADIRRFSTTDQIKPLFFVIEQYLGKPLSANDMGTVMFFHENLGFSTDLIEYLFEYCIGGNHKSFRYIEKVAIDWAGRGINTVAKAKAVGQRYSTIYYSVLKAFGINGRTPAPAEADFIKRWSETYGFTSDMILEACNRTIQATHQPSFEYTESILKTWKEKKVFSIKEVKQLDEAYAKSKSTTSRPSKSTGTKPVKSSTSNRFHNFDQRSVDYSDIEQKLLHKMQTTSDK